VFHSSLGPLIVVSAAFTAFVLVLVPRTRVIARSAATKQSRS
jgi:multisubunit Na+/H+ antiporter MnhC subunit